MSNSYEHLSREDLLSLLIRRDNSRKLGLVWEQDDIEREKSLNNDFVVLEPSKHLSHGDENWDNLIIEGENFDALRYLQMTHYGKVKCIYIDPPYNTGNKDFIYNDSYIDKDDGFKHSKWLEFMHQRLSLAKKLLAEDGVIFVSIDDEELGHLSMLMDQIFVGMKVGNFVWKRRTGANDAKEWFLSTDHEYILCYANPGFTFEGTKKDNKNYTNPDNDPRGPWTSGDLTKAATYKQRPNAYYHIMNPENGIYYPCNPDNVWRFASKYKLKENQKTRSKTMEQLIEEGKVLFPKNDNSITYSSVNELRKAIEKGTAPYSLKLHAPDLEFFINKPVGYAKPMFKRHLCDIKKTEKPLSSWIEPSSNKRMIKDNDEVSFIETGMTSEGTTLIKQVMGYKAFDHPKPLSLIKNLIRQSTDRNNGDIVLDFFAGSGTTGHATLALNNEDGGNRKFILISSTESTEKDPDKNICRDVTAKRIKNVLQGYSYRTAKGTTSVNALNGNFAYLSAKKLKYSTIRMNINHDQIWVALQMMHNCRINTFNTTKSINHSSFYDGQIIGYISNVSESVLEYIENLISNYSSVVIYSWSPQQIRQNILSENLEIKKIPDILIEKFGV